MYYSRFSADSAERKSKGYANRCPRYARGKAADKQYGSDYLSGHNLPTYYQQGAQKQSKRHRSHKNVNDTECFSYRKPAINPPTYDGSSSFMLFKQQFEEAIKLNGWQSQKEIALWLRISLKGQARDIVYDDCYDISELWHRLETRYSDYLNIPEYRRKLALRKRNKNESLDALSSDIRLMCSVVYSNSTTAVQDQMALTHFLSAINDVNMQYAIEIQNPATFDQAVLYAKTREKYFSDSNSSDCFTYAQQYTEAHYYPDHNGFAHSTAEMGNADPILK